MKDGKKSGPYISGTSKHDPYRLVAGADQRGAVVSWRGGRLGVDPQRVMDWHG